MADFLTFFVAGLAGGAAYALLALGLVLVARSSRLLHIGLGEVGTFGAFVAASLAVSRGWPWGIAAVLGIAGAALLGAGSATVLLAGPDRGRVPPLVGTVALLSVLITVEARYMGGNRIFPSPLHGDGITIGDVTIPPTRLFILGSVAVVCLVLWFLIERTSIGLALRAGADDRDAAAVIGLRPKVNERVAWAIAAGLAGLAGILLGWNAGAITPGFLTLAITRAFAGAMVGGMTSFTGAAAGGLLVGVAESLTRKYWGGTSGSSDMVVFAMLGLVLLARSFGPASKARRSLGAAGSEALVSLRSLVQPPTARPGAGGLAERLGKGTVIIAAVSAVAWLVPTDDAFRVSLLPIYGLLALSLNGLLATTGQLSLGHGGIFGLAAFFTGIAVSDWDIGVVPSIFVGISVGALVALVLGFVALRIQGLYLAVLTLAFAGWLEAFLFPKELFSKGGAGLRLDRADVGFISLTDDRVFLAVCLGLLALVVLAERRLAASPIGRAFVAVRENEVVASARAIPPIRVKVAAFAASGAVAGLAGALFAHRQGILVASSFPLTLSFSLLVYVVLGGIGSRPGVLAVTGVFIWTQTGNGDSAELLLLAGAGLIVLAIGHRPDGLGGVMRDLVARVRHRDQRPAVVDLEPDEGASTELVHYPRPPRPILALPDGRRGALGLLVATDVSITFGAVRALDGVSLRVEPAEVVGIIGPNGAGKTTLFNCLSGLVRPSAGSVWFAGRRIDSVGPADRARAGMARTFQQGGLFGAETALGNLLIAQHGAVPLDAAALLAAEPGGRAAERARRHVAEEVLSILHLEELADVPMASVPYGTRRLLELGCALVTRPRVILLDEPAAGLSEAETARLAGIIGAVRQQLGVAVVVIEHHVPFVRRVADSAIALDGGRLVATGTPEQVVADPVVRESYLGASSTDIPVGQA